MNRPSLTIASGDGLTVSGTATLAHGAALIVQGSFEAAQLSVDAASSLDFDAAGSMAFAGAISGAGGLMQSGPGTLTLSGADSYAGATAVTGSTLLVNGSTGASSAVAVAAGAVLGGAGTVGGSVDLSGALSAGAASSGAGNSPSYGTLALGALTMEAGSALDEEIGGAGVGESDEIAVQGAAQVGGTLDLAAVSGSATGDLFTVLTAGGGITGTFTDAPASGDTLTASGRVFVIDYLPNAITLTDVTSAQTPAPSPTPTPTPAPSPTPTPIPTPMPTPVPPDVVAIAPTVTYKDGLFTLSGTTSSLAGVRSVEITARVDGVAKDLGAATVDAQGNFSFADMIGAHAQGFITATLTDGAGGTAAGAVPGFSLTGGLGPSGGQGRQTRYSADGSAETAVTRFLPDGSQRATVVGGGQAFASSFFDRFDNKGAPHTTIVFNPGFGRDVVSLFRVDGTDHDSLSFKGSDFGATPADQLAGVLSHSRDTAAGLVITDPTASSPGPGGHDKVLLTGTTKAQLTANQADINFHA